MVFANYWVCTVITTVGYGDVYPITVGGKIFTVIVLFIGLGVIAVPTGLISTALNQTRDMERKEDEQNAKKSNAKNIDQ